MHICRMISAIVETHELVITRIWLMSSHDSQTLHTSMLAISKHACAARLASSCPYCAPQIATEVIGGALVGGAAPG